MKIAVLTDTAGREELLSQNMQEGYSVQCATAINELQPADAVIDLLFEPETGRIDHLKSLQPTLIIVNSVTTTLAGLPDGFIRINGWRSFLKSPLVEASASNHELADHVFSSFNKKISWVPDTPGFVSARVVSMIVNEAYHTLDEKVSTKDEIDTAMKLGTSYPYGPFEWSTKIGLNNIHSLLTVLSKTNPRYQPNKMLVAEAAAL